MEDKIIAPLNETLDAIEKYASDFRLIQDAVYNGVAEVDGDCGCIVEPDGYCPCGNPSILISYGMI